MDLHGRTVRRDVRELGELLGDVLADQTPVGGFDTVEALRTAAIDYRRGDRPSRDDLRQTLTSIDPDLEHVVARAFTTYFELINLAEERQRVRAIREARQDATIEHGLAEAAAVLTGADEDIQRRILHDVLIEPTFTAHPTEARRKTIKAKLRSIAAILETLDERRLLDEEHRRLLRDIEAEVISLWQTSQVRSRQPEPTDEARNVQWYFENTLFDVIPDVYDELATQLQAKGEEPIDIPPVFEFHSWAGSDRDGNPHVTPEVTEQALERHRDIALERYRSELRTLTGVLSQDAAQVDTGSRFDASLERDRERLPATAAAARRRFTDEPYRQKVAIMRERLARVGTDRPGRYESSTALLGDLERLGASLERNGARPIVESHVEPVRRQVETFGFVLATMDLRDHRENHTRTVAELLERRGTDYSSLSEADRVERLTELITATETAVALDGRDDLSATATRVCDRFVALVDWQAEYGEAAIDTYCISMTEEPSHVLEVLFLADQAGIVDLPDRCGLGIVPLLETESALSRAREIMGTLFENAAYRPAVDCREGPQEIMIGYSDSNKENGFLAATWSLYRNQRRLAAIAADHDVQLRFFHGRGGSISRGGGPMNEAMGALPRETVTGQIKFTEQGEAIAEKYANPRIAKRELEQMLNAQIRARREALEAGGTTVPDAWRSAMAKMADAAREEYRDLLTTEGFVPYFERATPIDVIETLNLGSRPASRTDHRRIEDLRAIPWVFSWTQSRCIIPGWYALGTGIEDYLEADGDVETLRSMYDDWAFFRTTIDNAALSLARTDMEIAAEYAELAEEEHRARFYPRIDEEYDRTVEHVRTITEREDLLTREWLRESLDRRNPYVDPLNLLQVRLLNTEDRTDEEERTLRLSVKGIAAGMKNTG